MSEDIHVSISDVETLCVSLLEVQAINVSMADLAQDICITMQEATALNIAIADEQPINITIAGGVDGAPGPTGPTGPIDPNSHRHTDPKAITRVMTYVPEFKAYEIVE